MEKICGNCKYSDGPYCSSPGCEWYSNWVSYKEDPVNKPSHYKTFPDMEAIDIIKATLTEEEYKGYLKGNFLKYRLRAGFKDDIMQDLDKSHVYRDWLFDLEGNTLNE